MLYILFNCTMFIWAYLDARGAYHVFLWSMWWLAQACKVGPVIFLISGTVIFSKSSSAVILLPCKLDATERSMHILRYFSKDVLNICLWSIHSCSWLQLWSSLACHFRALLFLQNVSWQIVYMLFNFARVVVDPCMLWTCSWLGLFHKHVFLMMLCLSCHAMTCGEWIKLVK